MALSTPINKIDGSCGWNVPKRRIKAGNEKSVLHLFNDLRETHSCVAAVSVVPNQFAQSSHGLLQAVIPPLCAIQTNVVLIAACCRKDWPRRHANATIQGLSVQPHGVCRNGQLNPEEKPARRARNTDRRRPMPVNAMQGLIDADVDRAP